MRSDRTVRCNAGPRRYGREVAEAVTRRGRQEDASARTDQLALGIVIAMPEFPLILNAPSRDWAEHVDG
jgi:hypothetical protein